jgi:hypothetical protein
MLVVMKPLVFLVVFFHSIVWPGLDSRMEVRGSGMEVWKVEGPAHQETEEPQPTGSRVLIGLGEAL